MSSEFNRRGRNWYVAMGVLFIVTASVIMVQHLILWTPDFVLEFLLNGNPNSVKLSVGMIGFGCIMVALGYRKHVRPPR
ncbi:conserved hypothetical protein [Cenarchaeum symbiosum A]|uniref:Uncharacterized protein n=1 Tax=Cenarchaeum symbiosum (strain A) TaxID=414004 RepID=A0RZ14_CENSY|nr:conserved hypothetical protein [Cenarchaeum symbiosum A]